MSQKVIFKYGNESDIPATKEAGQLLFAIKSDGTGNIYFDKDASTRIKMGLGTEGGTINGTLLFQNAKKEGHLKLYGSDEGGNIQIQGPNNTHYWEMDARNNNQLRLYCHDIDNNLNYGFWTWNSDLSTLFPGKIQAPRAHFTSSNDALETANKDVVLRLGAENGAHLDLDDNEIIAKNDAATMGTLHLQGLKITEGGNIITGAWNGSAIAVNKGGTGATTADGACANIGAVKKSGDIMTGDLTATGLAVLAGHKYPSTTLKTTMDDRSISYGAAMAENTMYGQMVYNDGNGYAEYYMFPDRTSDETGNAWHSILTSKKPVTIAQGGTGLTKAGEVQSLFMNSFKVTRDDIKTEETDVLSLPTGIYHHEGTTSLDNNYPIAAKRAMIEVIGQQREGTAAPDGYPDGYWAVRVTYPYSGEQYWNHRIWSAWTGWRKIYNTANKDTDAVQKSGDTMTGKLRMLGAGAEIINSSWPVYGFASDATGEVVGTGGIFQAQSSRRIGLQEIADGSAQSESYLLPVPDKQDSAKWYDILTTKNPVSIAQGGTGATTASGACDSIGAVKKTGDTMTGNLTVPYLCIRNNGGWIGIDLFDEDGNYRAGYSCDESNRVFIRQKNKDMADGEYFCFSPPTTSGHWYEILTSKTPVTVAQGGTGATTFTSGQALIGNGTSGITTRAITDNTAVGALISSSSWTSNNSNLVTLNTLAFWNGAHAGNHSNLSKLATVTTGTWQATKIGIAYGGTNADNANDARKNLAAFGLISGITSTTDDTVAKWCAKLNGYAFYSTAGQINGQPNQWGFLLNYVNGTTEAFQIWRSQPGGATYWRSGNGSGWATSWTKVYDELNKPTASELGVLPLAGGTMTGQLSISHNSFHTLKLIASSSNTAKEASIGFFQDTTEAWTLGVATGSSGTTDFGLYASGIGLAFKVGKASSDPITLYRHLNSNTSGTFGNSLQVGSNAKRQVLLYSGDDHAKISSQDASWFEYNAMYMYDTHTYFKQPIQIVGSQFLENGNNSSYGLDLGNSDVINASGIYFADDSNAAGEGLNFYRGNDTWDSLLATGGKLYFVPNRAKNSVGTRYEVYHAGGSVVPVSKGGTGVTTTKDLKNLVHNSYNDAGIANTVDVFTLAPGVYHCEDTTSTDKNYPIAESRATVEVFGQYRTGTAAGDGYANGYWTVRITYSSGKQFTNHRYWSSWSGWKTTYNSSSVIYSSSQPTGAQGMIWLKPI